MSKVTRQESSTVKMRCAQGRTVRIRQRWHGCARAPVPARRDKNPGHGRRGGGYGVVRSGICRWVEHGGMAGNRGGPPLSADPLRCYSKGLFSRLHSGFACDGPPRMRSLNGDCDRLVTGAAMALAAGGTGSRPRVGSTGAPASVRGPAWVWS